MSRSKKTRSREEAENAPAATADDVPKSFAWWQHLLAAFVLFHVVGAVLMAAPSPEGSLRRSAWKEPTAQAEFHAWAEGVRSMGIDVTDKEFEDFLWDVGKKYVDIKKTILTPYAKYAHYSGARQGWRMFVAPHRNPSTINVDIELPTDDGTYQWKNVYGSETGLLGPDHDYSGQWRSRQFRHNRVAKTIFLSGWKFRRNRYREFAHWIAEMAAKDFPNAKRVRIRMFRFKTLTPEEVMAGKVEEGRFHNTRTFDLDRIRKRQAKDAEILEKLKSESAEQRRAEEKQSEARREAKERRAASKKRKAEKKARDAERRKRRGLRRANDDGTRSAPKPPASKPVPPMPAAKAGGTP